MTQSLAALRSMADIPGPAPLPLVGNAPSLLTMEVHERFLEYTLDYGAMTRFRILNKPALLINAPELFERVMITDRDSYYKETPTAAFKPIVRDSIFIVNKPKWDFGREHHPYTSDYARCFLEGMVPTMLETTRATMIEAVEKSHGRPLDLYPTLLHTVFRSFTKAITGEVMSDALYRDFVTIMAEGAFRLKWKLPSINPKFWLALRRWYRFLEERIEQSLSQVENGVRRGLLGQLAQHGSRLTAENRLLPELSTLITGGAHPVATGLAAVLYLANKHPRSAARVVLEVRSYLDQKRGAPITLAEVEQLPELDRFLNESLRLYSPVAVITRAVRPGVTANLGGVDIPEKTEVFMSSWAMHRSPEHWEDPLRFDPSRFEVEPSPLVYFPFGIGERTCVGKPFALACMRTMLVSLFSEFEITLDASKPLRTTMSTGFVKPKGRLRAGVRPLSGASTEVTL